MDENADVRSRPEGAVLGDNGPRRSDLLRALGRELVLLVSCFGQSASDLRAWEELHRFLPWFLFEEQLKVWVVVDDEGARERARRDARLPHVPMLTRHEATASGALPELGDGDRSRPMIVLLDRGLRVRFESHSLGPEDVDRLRETTDRAREPLETHKFEVRNG